jgi:hypothetical protein
MSKILLDPLNWNVVLNILLIGLGFWIPVFLTHQYQIIAEKKKEKAFNKNTLILLSQELDVIRSINERMRKSSHRIVEACKTENRLVFDGFPHRFNTATLESLISNLILYRDQNPKLLQFLIELKSNLLVTNESLDFRLLEVFVDNSPKDNKGTTVGYYFESIFKHLEANFDFIEVAKKEITL